MPDGILAQILVVRNSSWHLVAWSFFVHVHVVVVVVVLMIGPRILDMRAWKRNGEFVGYWQKVDESVVAEKHGRTMLSDFLQG